MASSLLVMPVTPGHMSDLTMPLATVKGAQAQQLATVIHSASLPGFFLIIAADSFRGHLAILA